MIAHRLRSLSPILLVAVFGCAEGGGSDRDLGTSGPDAFVPPEDDLGTDAAAVDAGGSDLGVTDLGAEDLGADGGPEDLGADLGAEDLGVDLGVDGGPPPGCTTAAECSDGLACNGVEACVGGTCQAGAPFACDDGVPCTRDTCVEGASPTCAFTPDDALCGAGQSCTASGCASMCTESPCRLVSPQCGCGTGQACVLNGAVRACTTAGTTPVGSTCSGAFSCVPGAVCLNVSQDAAVPTNTCNRYCETDADCGGGLCFYTLDDGAGGSIPDVTVCTTACDPAARTGCPSGTACTIYRESTGSMRFFTDCTAPVGTGTQYASCTDETDCASGFGCIGTPGECLRWCDGVGFSGSLGGCPTGLTCYGFTTPITVGGTTYGVCDI